jgi:transposase
MRRKGTAPVLEAVRRRAVSAVLAGQAQAAVAAAFGVHPVTVAKWVARHRAAGDAGLAARPHPGRPRRLTAAQDAQVRRWLAERPTAHGFRTDLWTSGRVAELIRRRFGVAFHPNSLRKWLKQRGLTPQRPARKVRQRDDARVAGWVADEWPRVQKKSRRPRPTSS